MGRLTSENRPLRPQFLPDLLAHSPAVGQNEVSVKTNLYSSYVAAKKGGAREVRRSQKWTAAVDFQPTLPKSDRLLAQAEWAQAAIDLVAFVRWWWWGRAASILPRPPDWSKPQVPPAVRGTPGRIHSNGCFKVDAVQVEISMIGPGSHKVGAASAVLRFTARNRGATAQSLKTLQPYLPAD